MLNFLTLLGGEEDEERTDLHAPRDRRGVALARGSGPPSQPRRSMTDAAPWDEFWIEQMRSGMAGFVDFFCRDGRLVDAMRANRFKTILCVGNGVSQEPKALALAGFHVTALDISPLAIKIARQWDMPKKLLLTLTEGRQAGRRRPVRFVVGDLCDPSVCPGPFDVVLERKTLQLFPNENRPAAMRALAARLATPGIFFSHSHRNFASPVTREDYPSDWFHAEHWPLSQGGRPITTRVAWLSNSSG
jgi:SAM-dependent methyltransferase